MKKFLGCKSISIDPIFDDIDLDKFIEDLPNELLVHNGKYEIYILTIKNEETIVYSMKKETLRYMDICSDQFFYKIIDSKKIVYVMSTDEYDLFRLYGVTFDITKKDPIFIVDYIHSICGELITPKDIISKFEPVYISKQELLVYFFKLFITRYTGLYYKDYDRLIKSAKAEQLLNDANIFVDMNKLTSYSLANPHDSEVKKFLNKVIEGNGFVSSKYYSRDKRTFRIFPKRGELNFITLNNKFILDSMVSRYGGGKIICLDYSNYEYSILMSMLKLDLPKDFHLFAANKLNVDREKAKKINFSMLYGRDTDVDKLMNNNTIKWNSEYLDMIFTIRRGIKELINNQVKQYEKCGYVKTGYGRKIYPKDEASILNNIIQSTGVDLLLDVLVALKLLSRKKDWNILFQRFDSIYFDFSPDAIKEDLPKVMSFMVEFNESFNLTVNCRMGESVFKLKEI